MYKTLIFYLLILSTFTCAAQFHNGVKLNLKDIPDISQCELIKVEVWTDSSFSSIKLSYSTYIKKSELNDRDYTKLVFNPCNKNVLGLLHQEFKEYSTDNTLIKSGKFYMGECLEFKTYNMSRVLIFEYQLKLSYSYSNYKQDTLLQKKYTDRGFEAKWYNDMGEIQKIVRQYLNSPNIHSYGEAESGIINSNINIETGYIQEFYSNGNIKCHKNIYLGKYDGYVLCFTKRGRIKEAKLYENGILKD